jgi:threonine/homoserine/homoserine lactone efflux protein
MGTKAWDWTFWAGLYAICGIVWVCWNSTSTFAQIMAENLIRRFGRAAHLVTFALAALLWPAGLIITIAAVLRKRP